MHCSPAFDRRELNFSRYFTLMGWLRHRDNARQSGRCIRSRWEVVFVVMSMPVFQFFLDIGKAHEPVPVQAIRPKSLIEGLNEPVVSGLAWPEK